VPCFPKRTARQWALTAIHYPHAQRRSKRLSSAF